MTEQETRNGTESKARLEFDRKLNQVKEFLLATITQAFKQFFKEHPALTSASIVIAKELPEQKMEDIQDRHLYTKDTRNAKDKGIHHHKNLSFP